MKSDKELIREGNYMDALGKNYNPKPYYIVFTDQKFKDKVDPLNILDIDNKGFETFEECLEYSKNFNLPDAGWQIFNSNSDWL